MVRINIENIPTLIGFKQPSKVGWKGGLACASKRASGTILHTRVFSTMLRNTVPYSDGPLLLHVVKVFKDPGCDSQGHSHLCARCEHLKFSTRQKLLRKKRWSHLKWAMESRSEPAWRGWSYAFSSPPSNLITWLNVSVASFIPNSNEMENLHLWDHNLPFLKSDSLASNQCLNSIKSISCSSGHLLSSEKGMFWGSWEIIRHKFTFLSVTALNRTREREFPSEVKRVPKDSCHHSSWYDPIYKYIKEIFFLCSELFIYLQNTILVFKDI